MYPFWVSAPISNKWYTYATFRWTGECWSYRMVRGQNNKAIYAIILWLIAGIRMRAVGRNNPHRIWRVFRSVWKLAYINHTHKHEIAVGACCGICCWLVRIWNGLNHCKWGYVIPGSEIADSIWESEIRRCGDYRKCLIKKNMYQKYVIVQIHTWTSKPIQSLHFNLQRTFVVAFRISYCLQWLCTRICGERTIRTMIENSW